MSAPIPIPSSRALSLLYVPVHRRSPSSSSSRTPSPSRSSVSSDSSHLRTTSVPFVYTPADLLSLAHSPLAQQSAGDMDARLRAVAPEVVQTRKQRKALAWHAHHSATAIPTRSTPARRPPRTHHTSESEEERVRSWRRTASQM